MILNRLSLRAQLNAVILLVLALSFVGSVFINIINTQSFLTKQLTSHAQDTATSLGLALSAPLADEDKYLIESTINAIFDHGYYQQIVLTNINGEILYQRQIDNQPEQVPQWFVDTFELQAPVEQSMIDTGWVIGGVLKVQSHTGFAYADLWKSANDAVHFTLFIFVFALLMGYLILRQVYKPINEISQQAKLVNSGEFKLIETIPRAIELRSFVLAMNQMIGNIKSTFEELTEEAEQTRKSAYIDIKTGIENRRAFNDNLDALLTKSMQFHGHLGMLRVTNLDAVNKQCGYQAGDQLIADVIAIFKQLQSHVKIYRISGSEFGFIIENQTHNVIKNIAQNLVNALDKLQPPLKNAQAERMFALGIVAIKSEDVLSKIMYQLDVQTNNSLHTWSGYCLCEIQLDQAANNESASSFKSKIEEIIANSSDSITLATQSLLSCNDSALFDAEVFAVFNYKGKPVNTAEVFSVAAQFNLSGQLDVAITEKVIAYLKTASAQKLALNISYVTYNDSDSMDKIFAMIKQAKLKQQLVIQFMEQSILTDLEKAQTYMQNLNEIGCLTCINRFGASIESLSYLMETRPNYIKISPNFTNNIDKKEQNAILISRFIRMAHGLDIPVIANCVETQAELVRLQELKIDGALGYAIDKPVTIVN